MTTYFVDLTGGSNSNDGLSAGAPFKDFQPINTGALWNNNTVQVKRGSSAILNSGTRANINAASSSTLTAYGNASDPLPVLSGGVINFNPVWIQSGQNILVEKMHATMAPGSGIVVGTMTGTTLNNITVQDCLVTKNTQNSGNWGTDGLTVGHQQVDAGAITNVKILRVIARDNGGHGMKARIGSINVEFRDCVALRSGLRTPAHGIGSSGSFVDATAGAWTDTGFTNGGGKIWEKACTYPLISSVSSWFGVWVLGISPIYKLPYSATPTLPGPNECGIGANNTVRINIGAASPASLSSVYVVGGRPEDARFFNCVAAYTVDGVTKFEGDGVYFDNGSYKCYSYDCAGYMNDGNGAFMNDNTECGHYRFFSLNNKKGGIAITRGDGTNVIGGTFVCLPGTGGIRYFVGNQRGKARNNQVIGASIGLYTNDSATNQIAEDENTFINCAQTRTVGVAAGARSSAVNAFPAIPVNKNAYWAMDAISKAELVI